MSIPLSIGGQREACSRDTGLQFVVGQDESGRRLAVESNGRGGVILVNRQAALNYAAFEEGPPPDAVRRSTKPLTLWRRSDASAPREFGARK